MVLREIVKSSGCITMNTPSKAKVNRRATTMEIIAFFNISNRPGYRGHYCESGYYISDAGSKKVKGCELFGKPHPVGKYLVGIIEGFIKTLIYGRAVTEGG